MKVLLLAITAICINASAGPHEDLARARTVLPKGQDVAQVAALIYSQQKDSEINTAVLQNIMFADFNKDGAEDLLVISEENPKLVNRDSKPCLKWDPVHECDFEFGKRELRFYYGDKAGRLTLAFANSGIMMGADEGGMMGDPLYGLRRTRKGSVILSFSGGSAWKWSTDITIQYRKTDFYVVGLTTGGYNPAENTVSHKDENLITGFVIETEGPADSDKPSKVRKYKVKTRDLIPASKYEIQ